MYEVFAKTKSVCPVCLRTVDAEKAVAGDGFVHLIKTCPEHGFFDTLIWEGGADEYLAWGGAAASPEPEDDCPRSCGLCGNHESAGCCVLLELTHRCDLRCPVCFASAGGEGDLTIDEVAALYDMLMERGGPYNIQLSGGEPTVREDLCDILRLGKELGVVHLQVNTNGIKLANVPGYAEALKAAGCDLIYLQFDGLDDAIYREIRTRDMLDIKLRAIENCEAAGLAVLLVPVVIPGVNLHRIGEIVDFAKKHIPTIRGIHFQPVSYFGRFPGQTPPDESRCGLSDVLHALVEQCPELKMEHFVPRKQFDPHCDFSSTYYLDEGGRLVAMSRYDQNDEDTERTDFVQKTNKYTVKRWKGQEERVMDTPLMRFAERTLTHSFCISGMGFQDVWNIDLGRLHGCCVHIITGKCEVIPFCAFHLTGVDGKRLYTN